MDRGPMLAEVQRPAKEPYCGVIRGSLKGQGNQVMKDLGIQAKTFLFVK